MVSKLQLILPDDSEGWLKRTGYANYPFCRLCHQPITRGGWIYQARAGSRIHIFGLHPQCERVYIARIKRADLGVMWETQVLLGACHWDRKTIPAPFQYQGE